MPTSPSRINDGFWYHPRGLTGSSLCGNPKQKPMEWSLSLKIYMATFGIFYNLIVIIQYLPEAYDMQLKQSIAWRPRRHLSEYQEPAQSASWQSRDYDAFV